MRPAGYTKLTPPSFVRRLVFGMTQAVYAEALGLRQGTVSKWESAGKFTSVEAMERVRALGEAQKIKFNDTWLFEVPDAAKAQAKKKAKP